MFVLGIEISEQKISVAVLETDSLSCVIQRSQNINHQSPVSTWRILANLIFSLNKSGCYQPLLIKAIGISSTVDKMVLLNKSKEIIRSTKQELHQAMFMADYLSLQLTGEATTTTGLLAAASLWDYQYHCPHQEGLMTAGIPSGAIPPVYEVFDNHGLLQPAVANQLGMRSGTPVLYKAAALENIALGLQVLRPFEAGIMACREGTIITVSDQVVLEEGRPIDGTTHINHYKDRFRTVHQSGVGKAGALYQWLEAKMEPTPGFAFFNQLAATVPVGSDGLTIRDEFDTHSAKKNIIDLFAGYDEKLHSSAHMARAVLEGITFRYRIKWEELKKKGLVPSVIHAPKAGLFLSGVFCKTMANLLQTKIELYQTDYGYSAALGAVVGLHQGAVAGVLKQRQPAHLIIPDLFHPIEESYSRWYTHHLTKSSLCIF